MHKNMKNAFLISASIVHQKISPAILLAGKIRSSVAISVNFSARCIVVGSVAGWLIVFICGNLIKDASQAWQ
jgi:hypothetical protein